MFGLMENLCLELRLRYQLQHMQYTMEHQSLKEFEATGTQKICLFLD
ncbi:uncharacterized protein METZ01_LOCUS319098 [marine metagenome]|uniref:Uncharacterized protein n=1 Tax=marine metagenome TaxID=408172 RepID=A0A382NYI7_9ZZZZ